MTQTNIDKVLEDGFKKARLLMYQAVWKAMRECAIRFVREAVDAYNGGNLTGNTITSISAGIYAEGMPQPEIVSARDVLGLKNPIRKKLHKGETFEGEDYDGRERSGFTADVETDGDYGEGTSFHILQSYKLPAGCTFGIVVTTGTEYSDYLTKERELHYDVLVSTFKKAPNIAQLEWKKIKV